MMAWSQNRQEKLGGNSLIIVILDHHKSQNSLGDDSEEKSWHRMKVNHESSSYLGEHRRCLN